MTYTKVAVRLAALVASPTNPFPGAHNHMTDVPAPTAAMRVNESETRDSSKATSWTLPTGGAQPRQEAGTTSSSSSVDPISESPVRPRGPARKAPLAPRRPSPGEILPFTNANRYSATHTLLEAAQKGLTQTGMGIGVTYSSEYSGDSSTLPPSGD